MSMVATALTSFNDYIHSGEPTVRQWFLLRSIRSPLLISGLYLLFVKFLGPAIMRDRKPIVFRRSMSVYNFGLVAFYIYFLLRGALFLPELGLSCFCGQLSMKMGPVVEKFFSLGWQLYMIKYVELLDTIFLVMSKKFNMISTLHVTHHAVVPIFGFMGFRSETSAYLSVFMVLNSIIHVIMYTYYGVAVLGPQYQKYLWWKKYLTTFQILQFLFMTLYMTFMSYIGCITSKFTLYFCCGISLFFCYLFINYYKQTFCQPNQNSKPPCPEPKKQEPLTGQKLSNGVTRYKSHVGNGVVKNKDE